MRELTINLQADSNAVADTNVVLMNVDKKITGASTTDSNGDGLANADHVGVGRPMTKAASRCRLRTESGTNELLAQRP